MLQQKPLAGLHAGCGLDIAVLDILRKFQGLTVGGVKPVVQYALNAYSLKVRNFEKQQGGLSASVLSKLVLYEWFNCQCFHL